MNIINELVSEYTAAILISLCCAVVILLFLCLVALLKVIRLKRRYDIFSGSNRRPSRNIEEKLNIYQEEVEEVHEKYEKILSIVQDMNNNMLHCIQKVGIIRYNPYKDVGGNLCFVVALLDGNNSGVVINGLHSRTGSFTYAKPVTLGTSTYVLTNEEQQAIDKAMKNCYIPSDREIVMERKIKVYRVKERGVIYRETASQESAGDMEEELEDVYDDIEEVLKDTFDDSREDEWLEEAIADDFTEEEEQKEENTEDEYRDTENIADIIIEETEEEEAIYEQQEESTFNVQEEYKLNKDEERQKEVYSIIDSTEKMLKKSAVDNPLDIIDKLSAEILQSNKKDKREHNLNLDELLKEELENKQNRLKLKANDDIHTEDEKKGKEEILDTDKLIEEAIKKSVLYHLVEPNGEKDKNNFKADSKDIGEDEEKK